MCTAVNSDDINTSTVDLFLHAYPKTARLFETGIGTKLQLKKAQVPELTLRISNICVSKR